MSTGLPAGLAAQLERIAASVRACGLAVPGSPACPGPRTWRGARLGGRLPVVAVSTTGRTPAEAASHAAAACAAGADVVELRLDLLDAATGAGPVLGAEAGRRLAEGVWPAVQQVAAAVATTRLPLLATLRTSAEGGGVEIDDDAYRALLSAVLAACSQDEAARQVVTALDVELARDCVSELAALAGPGGIDVLASAHFFSSAPAEDEIVSVLERMETQGAQVAKVAVMPASQDDVARLLRVAVRARGRLQVPVIAIAMGEDGVISRLAGGVFGSALTFATAGATASAPGQLPVAQVRSAMEELEASEERASAWSGSALEGR
ncbi:MAG: type I 3-dehydroquinate dehydratase [Actinomyces urogenitalis]|uniref:type I 3-dehydroquinate dehydratase n=1 Tax=Actinomyces urogenitalis TaxID=103621 RepID=UPI00290F7AC6|nr:type I 3-dehydroquinate dehydratase [Actinomyces urogenitalis]MDU6152549.1 type I 3-dehydroquinate dehydratase [Actinomyces urogenitalis]